jgi:NAD(P)-dependent dehydrogenase (short-subunit alcohol dehydrogenase family)
VNLVEKTGRRIVAEQADVRDLKRLEEVVAKGVAALGRIDFVFAHAGIVPGVIGDPNETIHAYLASWSYTMKSASSVTTSIPWISLLRSPNGSSSSRRARLSATLSHNWATDRHPCRFKDPASGCAPGRGRTAELLLPCDVAIYLLDWR